MKKTKTGKKRIDYLAMARELKPYHNFGFDLRKKLSPAMKAAITRTWKKTRNHRDKVESGEYTFIPFSRKLKKSVSKKLFGHTNKGIWFLKPDAKVVADGVISSRFGNREDFFIPLPTGIYKNQSLLLPWLEEIHKAFHPATTSISIRGSRGMGSYGLTEMERYITDAFNYFGSAKGHKNAINGVFVTTLTPTEADEVYGKFEERKPKTKKKQAKKDSRYRR